MPQSKHHTAAQVLAVKIALAWESEASMAAVFERCHRGPTFDRTAHGRAIVEKLFDETELMAGMVPTPWDRLMVAYFLVRELGTDYNLCTQVVPNLLPVPLQVDRPGLAAKVAAVAATFEGRTDVPNPFKEKRPKVKVTAATHSPEVVKDYAQAVGYAKAASILETADFGNLSFRVTPLGKTPAFSDSMSYGQLPVVADPFLQILPTYQRAEWASLFLSWGPDDVAVELLAQEDGSLITPTLPEGRNRFVSESGGSMLGQALASRSIAGAVLAHWATQPHAGLRAIAVIPRLNSVQVLGPQDYLETLPTGLPYRSLQVSWGVRNPLPAE